MCRLCAQIRAAPDIMLNKFATAKSRLKLDLLALESLIYIYIPEPLSFGDTCRRAS